MMRGKEASLLVEERGKKGKNGIWIVTNINLLSNFMNSKFSSFLLSIFSSYLSIYQYISMFVFLDT